MKEETTPQWVMLYIPCPTPEVAKDLARNAVSEHLAVCGNILPGLSSVYVWEGKACEEAETLLLLKTTQTCEPRLRALLETKHPYTIPCILTLAVNRLNAPYQHWGLSQLKEHSAVS